MISKSMQFSFHWKNMIVTNSTSYFKRTTVSCYDPLKAILNECIPQKIQQISDFRNKYNDTVVCQVTVDQIYSGMRGIKAMTYETSLLDPNKGIRFRDYTIYEVMENLPKFIYKNGSISKKPTFEGIFWLLCTGRFPSQEESQWLSQEWARRSMIPTAVSRAIDNFPQNSHPMAQFSAALSLLSYQSKYAEAQNTGKIKKSEQWQLVYEDSMDMIAKIVTIAAKIYRNIYADGNMCEYNKELDYSENFVRMMGFIDHPMLTEFMRLYLIIHCDHEGGNVSAHTNRLVASANADPYISFASAINGLSGPLHGRANQEVSKWLDILIENHGYDVSDEKLIEYINEWVETGVIPGYGHAVLRQTDPRFIVQLEFAQTFLPNDPKIKLINKLYKIVPDILKSLGKVKNPYPNLDAASGSILESFGILERDYYTVPFGVSRAVGVTAALIWDKALGLPLERPKSITSEALIKLIKEKS